MTQNNNILLVREYLQALADGEAGESLGRFLPRMPFKLNCPTNSIRRVAGAIWPR
ncbi:MAG: hypothetical protein H6633_09590 [Anaerolineales bacterium]|nr:hypothetical protein [Anaerolineales bacterium]